MLYVDTKTYMVADILTKVDRMSMATSLEVRFPYSTIFLWNGPRAAQSRMETARRVQKYILRKLAERVGVPREALYRPKQGLLCRWCTGCGMS